MDQLLRLRNDDDQRMKAQVQYIVEEEDTGRVIKAEMTEASAHLGKRQSVMQPPASYYTVTN